jgi:hypothetical protein
MGFSQTGNFVSISAAIVSVLEGVQQDGANAFAAVYNYPTIESTTGYPWVSVVPSDSPSSYLNVAQNLRSYTFFIDIYYPIEDSGAGYSNAFTTMTVLIETVLDALDNSNSLNGTAQIVQPSPSNWSMAQSSMGAVLDGRVILVAKVSTPQSNG